MSHLTPPDLIPHTAVPGGQVSSELQSAPSGLSDLLIPSPARRLVLPSGALQTRSSDQVQTSYYTIISSTPTDYFSCPLGVKQGSPDSPTLFSIFVDSLSRELKESGKGVSIETTSDNPDNPDITDTTNSFFFIICFI